MTKTVACITVRMSSSRLPLKALRDILPGVTILDYLIRRLKKARRIDAIYICTSTERLDDILEDVAVRNEVKIYRGSLENVVERFQGVGKMENPEFLVRLTGDNPFIDPFLLDEQIAWADDENLDYVRLTDVPLGATGEVVRSEVFDRLEKSLDPEVSEYLMLYLFDPDRFKCGLLKPVSGDYSHLWATVDTEDDLKKSRHLASFLEASRDHSLGCLIPELRRFERQSASSDAMVKLPRGQTMPYAEFQKMMESRKSKSLLKDFRHSDNPSL